MERANTIPEMALIISLVLLTLFGAVQYALVGFNQIGADGAAFVGDHAAVAQYNSPTSGNAVYAQQVALSIFPHATATYTASVPKNGTYEMNLSSSRSSIGMAQLFPSTVATRSRIVEPAQTVVNTQTPAGQCTAATEKLLYNGTSVLNRPINVLSNVTSLPLFTPITDANGNTALSFANGSVTSQTTALKSISNDLTATASGLATIGSALQALGPIGTPVAQAISAQLSPLLNSAAGGTYTAAGGGTVSITSPLTAAQFSTQVTASTNAINVIKNQNLLNGLITAVFSSVITPTLYGSSTTPGLLTGGPNGGILNDMNNAQNVLFGLDQAIPKC